MNLAKVLSGAAIFDYWIRVKSSYWFLPSVLTAVAIGVAVLMVYIDQRVDSGAIAQLGWLTANHAEGARALLATVAGSMITVAGVTFSMTLLMLSYASARLGPHLVSGLLRDRGSQLVLGTFIATFIYSIVVLRSVRSAGESAQTGSGPFVPHLAILVAVALALLSVAVLIYFIHHVPTRINVSHVVSSLGTSLVEQLNAAFPPRESGADPRPQWSDSPDAFTLRLDTDGGYLRIVDYDGLLAVACKVDRTLETLVMPGDFCVRGTPLVRVHGGRIEDDCATRICGLFSWGGERTPDQDVLFLIEQLAEVAGKALSPGVNDQFTALACIDQMQRLLRAAADVGEPQRLRRKDGRVRLVVKHVELNAIVDAFIIPLRQFSLGDLITTDRLLAMLADASTFFPAGSSLRSQLAGHYAAIRDDAAEALPAPSQKALIAMRCAEHERARAARLGSQRPAEPRRATR